MGIEKFSDLQVWREAHQLVLRVYEITRKFPSDERFGLISQMRRAALSIPANIAEGFKRRGLQDKIQFYNTAPGSLEELKYFFIVSKDLITSTRMPTNLHAPTWLPGCSMVSLPAPNAANMPPNPYSLSPTPAPHEPPLDMFGADAVERWFTEKEIGEVVEFANRTSA